jgi:GT2 family glycosyltransferase
MSAIESPGSSVPPDRGSESLVSVSIVSHGQAGLVGPLLDDLDRHSMNVGEVILTSNVPENMGKATASRRYPVVRIENEQRKGFGANHNAAFRRARHGHFCVLNPDIRLRENPFPALIRILTVPTVGLAAPLILNSGGTLEDSARRFPTIVSLAARTLLHRRKPEYTTLETPFSPDWVAGMFMLFRTDVFAALGGFDESFFLYFEDVDICARLRRLGLEVLVAPEARAIHDAQRRSHRDRQHARWHVASMLRYLARRHVLGTYRR